MIIFIVIKFDFTQQVYNRLSSKQEVGSEPSVSVNNRTHAL